MNNFDYQQLEEKQRGHIRNHPQGAVLEIK